jgi:hypothetical protein
MTRRNMNAEVAQKLDAIIEMMGKMDSRISALESAKTKVATTKKSTAKSAKTTAKKAATKEAPKKSSAKKTAPVTETKSKKNTMSIADFEPCKFKDTNNYVWGGAKGYKAMRSAYCYAKQTGGKARNLAEARALGVTIDFDKAWNKAKSEFEKKYVYVKAEDRQK